MQQKQHEGSQPVARAGRKVTGDDAVVMHCGMREDQFRREKDGGGFGLAVWAY